MKTVLVREKLARDKLSHTIEKVQFKLKVDVFEDLKDESRRVMIINKQGEQLGHDITLERKRRILIALADYRTHRYRVAEQRLAADKMRDRLL